MMQDILLDIDQTLDQLIQNAEAVSGVDDLNTLEIEAFQKTQESLIQRLLHMDQFLVEKKDSLKLPHPKSSSFKLQEKLLKFESMKKAYSKSFTNHNTRSILLKRKSKKLLPR
jgi:hypothetical protein